MCVLMFASIPSYLFSDNSRRFSSYILTILRRIYWAIETLSKYRRSTVDGSHVNQHCFNGSRYVVYDISFVTLIIRPFSSIHCRRITCKSTVHRQ